METAVYTFDGEIVSEKEYIQNLPENKPLFDKMFELAKAIEPCILTVKDTFQQIHWTMSQCP